MNDRLTVENCQFGLLRAKFNTDYLFRNRDCDWFAYGGARLCHYTNLHGLLGILDSGGFWISDFRFLNDTEEYVNGCRMAKEVIDSALSRSRPHDPVFVSILNHAIPHLSQNPEKTYFVCSFSEDDDSLEQWRAYAGGNDGICVIFENKPPLVESHFCIMPIMAPQKVIYDDSLKRKFLIRIIAKYSIELKKDIAHGYCVDIDDWSSDLAKALSMEFMIFKNKSFSSEKEVRIVISESHLNHFNGLRHRIANSRIIPYLNSSDLYSDSFVEHCGTNRLPISGIKVGPTANRTVTLESVNAFLRNVGYGDIPVVPSAVPFRG